jgi:hypothetical protein
MEAQLEGVRRAVSAPSGVNAGRTQEGCLPKQEGELASLRRMAGARQTARKK